MFPRAALLISFDREKSLLYQLPDESADRTLVHPERQCEKFVTRKASGGTVEIGGDCVRPCLAARLTSPNTTEPR